MIIRERERERKKVSQCCAAGPAIPESGEGEKQVTAGGLGGRTGSR